QGLQHGHAADLRPRDQAVHALLRRRKARNPGHAGLDAGREVRRSDQGVFRQIPERSPMMKARWILLAVPAFASIAAFAQNPYSQPWALVERGDQSDVRNELPVSISKVDGKTTRN